MQRMVTFTLALTTLIACSEDPGEGPGDVPALDLSVDTASPQEELDHAEIVYSWLKGDFDSSAQAEEDPTFFAVSLRSCDAVVPGLGERVLYVEQAMMDGLDRPYRQRIYSVEAVDDQVVSYVYAMSDALNFELTGACDGAEPPELSMDDIEERTGCAVWLTPEGEESYSGGTEGQECKSTLGGASYATSRVVVSARAIESWDQGWMASGEQAWGAVSGPYRFDRAQ